MVKRLLFNCICLFFTCSGSLLWAEQTAAPPPTLPIIEGKIGPNSLFPAVALVSVGNSFCTGTLIDRQYVLTAGHCVFNERGREVKDLRQVSLAMGTELRSAKSIHIHPKYDNTAEACTDGIPDASLIQLDEPITNITPIPIASSAPAPGEQLLLVGYGMLGSGRNGQNGQFPNDGDLSYGYTVIDQVSATLLSWRFRANHSGSNTAGGDSGGPAFQVIAGEKFLSSITCGGTGNAEWGTESYNTRVDILSDWLSQFIEQESDLSKPQFSFPRTLYARTSKSFRFPIPLSGPAVSSLVGSNLPPGLFLENQIIVGHPTVAGTYSSNFLAENKNGTTLSSVKFIVKPPDTSILIKRISLALTPQTSGITSLTFSGELKTSRALFAKHSKLTLKIGDFQQTFPILLGTDQRKRALNSFAISRITAGKGNRISLHFTLRVDNPVLLEEIRSLGFSPLPGTESSESRPLLTTFEFAGNEIITNHSLSLDSADLRWHLVSGHK